MLSSRSFIVSSLTFSSLIHFEFIFVYGVRECPNFILLHVAVQFSQHHLLKRLSFLHCIILPSLLYIAISAWVYFWAFYPVPLIYMSVFVPGPYCFGNCSFVVESGVRQHGSSSCVLLSQDRFIYSVSLVLLYKFKNFFVLVL